MFMKTGCVVIFGYGFTQDAFYIPYAQFLAKNIKYK